MGIGAGDGDRGWDVGITVAELGMKTWYGDGAGCGDMDKDCGRVWGSGQE